MALSKSISWKKYEKIIPFPNEILLFLELGLDVLVNNAGTNPQGDDTRDTSLEDTEKVMAVNYRACYILAREAIPYLEKVKGNIVFTGSFFGNEM